MKVIVAEGSPEELAKYEQLTNWTQSTEGDLPEGGKADNGLDGHILAFLTGRAGGGKRLEVADYFVRGAMARGDITPEPGTSKDSKDGYGNYVRLYRKGPRTVGALVYYTPSSGVADLRLPKEAAQDRPSVQVRYPDRDDEYNIRVRIDSNETADLALQLLDEAVRQITE